MTEQDTTTPTVGQVYDLGAWSPPSGSPVATIGKARYVRAPAEEWRPGRDWQTTAHKWSVTLEHEGRTMTVEWYQGAAINTPPTIPDVLHSLTADGAGDLDSFEDWCGDYGYDTDSRSAYRTWEAVKAQTEALRAMLGDDLEQITEALADH